MQVVPCGQSSGWAEPVPGRGVWGWWWRCWVSCSAGAAAASAQRKEACRTGGCSWVSQAVLLPWLAAQNSKKDSCAPGRASSVLLPFLTCELKHRRAASAGEASPAFLLAPVKIFLMKALRASHCFLGGALVPRGQLLEVILHLMQSGLVKGPPSVCLPSEALGLM